MDARLTLRSLLSIAALGAVVALTSACGGGAQAATKDPRVVRYSGPSVSFTHPAAWKAYAPQGPSALHFNPWVYLSTQPVHAACSTHANITSCGFPVRHLAPGGVLISWLVYGIPARTLGPGTPVRVGGRPARRVETAGGACRKLGADRAIDVAVGRTPGTPVYFTACLRGPGLAQETKSVDALLASVKFAGS
jgi:hypothetical protein